MKLAMTMGCLLAMASVAQAEYSEGMEAYRKAWGAYAAQRFEEADRWAQRAVKADPENGHAFSLMGELAYLRHDLKQARESWEKALALNPQLGGPLKEQIAQAQMEMELEREMREASLSSSSSTGGSDSRWSLPSTPIEGGNDNNLVIRVPKDLPAEQEQAILATLSQAMEGLEPYFQCRVKRPLTVLIYPREVFYGDGLHMPTEVLGLFDGKIRIPASPGRPEQAGRFPSTGSGRTAGASPGRPEQAGRFPWTGSGRTAGASKDDSLAPVIWHEYAHAVVYDLSHGRAPRWLQEGLAQEAERLAKAAVLRQASFDSVRPEQSRRANSAQDERLTPYGDSPRGDTPQGGVSPSGTVPGLSLRSLLGIAERPGEPVLMPANQFYAASHNLVEYLLELKGWDGMRRVLKALGAGQSVEEALRAEYGWNLETLEKKWKGSRRDVEPS